ncbi:DUF4340 domain-containing protein [Pseudomaricurvus alcaniphilus]|uniref:DUF4340 domain-containing protein n=1 Tax=Pseudomaricurvus alcaniphilus TaxID=1166482 RepID=UPI00140D0C50|nr:DUF4340 domain-containing protein [Pseudomaricurvus alcaniphilus]NHN38414.1 DUF4340 domain-containing protein [Pseudomaricurvus alcaniphilus]
MNKLTSWLGGLLALQLVLAAGLFWGDGAGQSEAIGQPLLGFEQAQIDKVVIGAGEEEVTLQRQDGQWRLPGQSDLPVDSGKLQPLLEQLHGLQSGWPVATSASSHQRFEVSEDTHQRRIRLFRDGQLVVDLYLGTSPGFKKVHGRRAADTEVYALPLNSFDFPTSADNWLDKTLQATGADEVTERPATDEAGEGEGKS